MATFSLTDLKNEVSKKYAPTVIENGSDEFVLPNLLQMPSKKRKAVLDLIESMDAEEADGSLESQVGTFSEILVLAEDNDRGEALLELLGDNSALIVELASRWMEATQLGEAARS